MTDMNVQTDDVLWRQLSEMNSALEHSHDRHAIVKVLEGLRDSTRTLLNNRGRPKLRALQILDLPNELLRHIFEHVRGDVGISELDFFDFPQHGSDAIQRARLTCRRFYETSSHLLLSYVTVDMTHSSLARLDEVSRHHYISKGIRAIKLSLFPVYDSVLAHDIRAFAMYHLSDLRQGIESWHEALDWLPNGGTSVEVCQRAITRAVSLAESWEELAARGVDASRADHLMISQAHEQYLQRYEDYDRLSCSLTQIITSAMGRMPTATWIKIYDPNIYKPPRWTPRVLDQPDSLLNCLLLPVGWSDVRQRRLGWLAPPPSHPICELLLSIQQLGISLVGLDIETPPPVPSSSASNMAITHDPTVFHHAVKRLKAVSFNLRDIWGKYWTGRAPEEWAYLTSFLLSLLHTDSLRKISLNFNFMRTDDPRSLLSMAPLLLSYTWPNLQHLYFNGPFHFEELKAAVKPLGQNAKLQWCGYLMSGSWADVLDFLRERNGPKQELGDQNGSIYGQECDRMSEDERNFIFWNDLRFHLTSRATDYIRRCLASNPVRDWEMVN